MRPEAAQLVVFAANPVEKAASASRCERQGIYELSSCTLKFKDTAREMMDNVGRIHQTLRVTPAMESGAANQVWSIEETVVLLS